MNNPFPYSDTNKRYHTFNYFLRHHFGCKVAKVSLDAGFTCPNLDGTKGTGGCTYCSSRGSGDFAGDVHLPLDRQFEQVRQVTQRNRNKTLSLCRCACALFHRKRWTPWPQIFPSPAK